MDPPAIVEPEPPCEAGQKPLSAKIGMILPINVDLDLNLDVDVDLLSGDKLLHAQSLSGYGSLLIACGAA